MKSKMTKSESGKLGAARSTELSRQKMKNRVESYNKNPTTCSFCDSPISYEKRWNKFCSSSCSAKCNNSLTPKRKQSDANQYGTLKPCLSCSLPVKGKYCNTTCQQRHRRSLISSLVERGKAENSGQVKKYLLETQGNKCSSCGITDWNGKPLNMELEHKDGNSDNNTLENCCLLCPNCHAQTPTYKAKNKGNGRAYRRARYAEGKSY